MEFVIIHVKVSKNKHSSFNLSIYLSIYLRVFVSNISFLLHRSCVERGERERQRERGRERERERGGVLSHTKVK